MAQDTWQPPTEPIDPEWVPPSGPQMNFATVNGKQVPIDEPQGKLKSLIGEGYNWAMKPLLPSSIDESKPQTENYLDLPILNKIYPGGIRMPSLQDVYEELVRPLSAPIGLLGAGLEGAIGLSGRLKSIPPEVPPEVMAPQELPKLQPLQLGPAPSEVLNKPRFLSGEAGIADVNTPYKVDMGSIQPHFGGGQGTVLPQELGQLNPISPELAANKGLSIGNPLTHTRTPAEAAQEALIPNRYNKLAGIPEPSKGREFNIGEPNAPYQLPTADKAINLGNKLDQQPEIASGDISKPPIDVAVSKEVEPIQPNLPKPGTVGLIATNFNSPNKYLARYESTAPIVKELTTAWDSKLPWIATTNRELLESTKGLNKAQRAELWNYLNDSSQSASPEIQLRANIARTSLDKIFQGLTEEGTDVNYLKDYITHIQSQSTDMKDAIKSIFNYHGINIPDTKSGELGDYYEKGLGNPNSPFIEERTGNLRNLETDPNKIFPAYVDSIAKLKFDRPAVDNAKIALEKVPDGVLKELAGNYIKNYTRYDADAELHNAWAKASNMIANTSARSFIGLNPGVHMLHVGQIPANIFPELGAKYSTLGFTDFVKNPVKNFRNMANLGMLQTEIKPFRFRTFGEKLDSILYGMSTIESMVKGTAYNGFLRKFIDEGMEPKEAMMRALDEAKNATLTVDPARMMKGFTPESNFIGGEYGARNTMQFKQIPLKFVEQYKDIASQLMQDKAKANRALWGAATAFGGGALGMHTFHLDPLSMVRTSALGGFGDVMVKIISKLSKGDVMGAITDTGTWLTPAGTNVKKLYKFATSE